MFSFLIFVKVIQNINEKQKRSGFNDEPVQPYVIEDKEQSSDDS